MLQVYFMYKGLGGFEREGENGREDSGQCLNNG